MDREEKYIYWLDIAEYDMETAVSLFESSRYLYVVFMCQQALEKLTKGLYCYFIDDNVPYVHNISFILGKVTDKLKINVDEEIFSLCDRLAAYYLQGRYPSYKEKISKLIDKMKQKEYYSFQRRYFYG